jgi:hypothetical protein
MMSTPSVVHDAILQGDYFRRSPGRHGRPAGFKEWLHFCIYGEDLDALLNFSVVDDVREVAPLAEEVGRVTALLHDPSEAVWGGGVAAVDRDQLHVGGGKIDATFGDSRLSFDGQRYLMRVRLPSLDLHGDLEIEPLARAPLIHNVETGDGPPINWFVVPRLLASGELRWRSKHYRFDKEPAYHDHNWGHFGWGRDFSWEWGFGLPRSMATPWCIVFARLSDRARLRTRMQVLFLWNGVREHRVWREHELTVTHEGLFRRDYVHKVPGVMGIISPGTATSVPARIDIKARGGADALDLSFTPTEAAQVIIPNDLDDGVTIINEVSGALEVEGRVRGDAVAFETRTIFEFLGA